MNFKIIQKFQFLRYKNISMKEYAIFLINFYFFIIHNNNKGLNFIFLK